MKRIADFIVKHERKIAVVVMCCYGVLILGISFRWHWIDNPLPPLLPWLPPRIPVPVPC